MVKLKEPAVVGVPEIRPEVFKFNPIGSDPEARLNVIGDCPPVVWV